MKPTSAVAFAYFPAALSVDLLPPEGHWDQPAIMKMVGLGGPQGRDDRELAEVFAAGFWLGSVSLAAFSSSAGRELDSLCLGEELSVDSSPVGAGSSGSVCATELGPRATRRRERKAAVTTPGCEGLKKIPFVKRVDCSIVSEGPDPVKLG